MKLLSSSPARNGHAYTKSKTPWLLETAHEAKTETSANAKARWRLFHYLSGGGLRAFGRTVEQEEAEAKRTRFLIKAAVAGAVWLYFWI